MGHKIERGPGLGMSGRAAFVQAAPSQILHWRRRKGGGPCSWEHLARALPHLFKCDRFKPRFLPDFPLRGRKIYGKP